MSRLLIASLMFPLAIALSACQSGQEEAAPKVAAPVVVPNAPVGNDDAQWKTYLQQVVSQNMAGVTDRVFPYYLPANSEVPTPGDPDGHSQYDRQLDNVTAVLTRTVLPGNMLVFGSPDSAKMADLIQSAFSGASEDALKGSQVLFIGKAEDSGRVRLSVQSVGAKYIFVEAK
jgi:hypothetical protein